MKKNNKGFTLMEMLIVVAIIAILVAIMIPTFTAQLEKAREAADLANIRSAYAEAMVESLTSTTGTGSATTEKMTQTTAGFANVTVPAYLDEAAKTTYTNDKATVGTTSVLADAVNGVTYTVNVAADGTVYIVKNA